MGGKEKPASDDSHEMAEPMKKASPAALLVQSAESNMAMHKSCERHPWVQMVKKQSKTLQKMHSRGGGRNLCQAVWERFIALWFE